MPHARHQWGLGESLHLSVEYQVNGYVTHEKGRFLTSLLRFRAQARDAHWSLVGGLVGFCSSLWRRGVPEMLWVRT
jgi:hypothetical protein